MEWTVVGVIVVLVGLVGSLVGGLYKLFFQPINELNSSIIVLIEKFSNMEERDKERDLDVKYNRETLIEHDKRITFTEKDIEELKGIRSKTYTKQY